MSASRLHYRRLRGGLKVSTKVSGCPYSLQIRSQVSEPPKASDRTACVRAAEPAERSRIASKSASGVYIDR